MDDDATDIRYDTVYDFVGDITADGSEIRAALHCKLEDTDDKEQTAAEALQARGDRSRTGL